MIKNYEKIEIKVGDDIRYQYIYDNTYKCCPKCMSKNLIAKLHYICDDCGWEGYYHKLLFIEKEEYIKIFRKEKLKKLNVT